MLAARVHLSLGGAKVPCIFAGSISALLYLILSRANSFQVEILRNKFFPGFVGHPVFYVLLDIGCYLLWHFLCDIFILDLKKNIGVIFMRVSFFPILLFPSSKYSNLYLTRVCCQWNHSLLSIQWVNSYNCNICLLIMSQL